MTCGSRAPVTSLVLILALGLIPLSGCATPAERADEIASSLEFDKAIVRGAPFRHVVYRNSVREPADVLHVYIEGDGSPFKHRTVIASDPTSRDPMMLRLMSEDRMPSVYLGRPCYFGLNVDADCKPDEWTSRRFAPEVLDSMETVLRAEIARSGASHVDLFGHSGGGTLAVLLALRIDSVARVITIAPTLDTAAWCELHGYSPLVGSINPVDLGAHRAGLKIIHWVGEKDTNTPASLVRTASQSRGDSVRVVAGFDHHCCWRRIWHDILNDSAEAEP
jgi:hypothetical protein